ncbi:MAG: hypothetical protein VXZ84_00505 [Planctomycetota bacterium]|nr:hypothetical protein [Planctomycetota bacterium]
MNKPTHATAVENHPGIDGFLPWRGSLMMDVVLIAMFAIVPLLCISIALVRYGKFYTLHKRIQITLGILLAVAVLLFEIEVRVYPWRPRAMGSPYFATDGSISLCGCICRSPSAQPSFGCMSSPGH